jgi:hypothetical protein
MEEKSVDTTLKIKADDLDAEDLQDLTRELSQSLRKETEVIATLPEGVAEPGTRGDPVTLGTIILTAFTSGAVVALFNVLKTYFERKPTLVMEFQRPDGKTFTVRADTLARAQIDQTIRLANDFWEK